MARKPLAWQRNNAKSGHLGHYDARNAWRRIVPDIEERYRDFAYPHHSADSTQHRQNIIEGLQSGADEYIVKPFNIGILRATIANLLANRALLRRKYANLELNDKGADIPCSNCSNDLDREFIAAVKKGVDENMDNPNFNVDTLCSLMNMSRTSFYNKIKALTDQAPADYIRLIKLKYAAQLLEEQRYSITEIAEKTGFNDAKYFREVFKKHFNVSPSQYAKDKLQEKRSACRPKTHRKRKGNIHISS